MILVQEALHQLAVHLLADAAVGAVDDIVDGLAGGQRHMAQVAQGVVGVGGGAGGGGLGLEVAGPGVAVGGVALAGEAVPA